jgi:hypothetical protein
MFGGGAAAVIAVAILSNGIMVMLLFEKIQFVFVCLFVIEA